MDLEQIEQNRDEGVILIPSPSKKKKQSIQAFFWCFTYNNYDLEQVEQIEHILKIESEWYVFQEEVGASGTRHLQGTLKLKNKKRIEYLCKLFDNKVHWEPTKAVKASVIYCSKKETRSGKIYTHNCPIPEEIKVQEPYGWQLEIMDIISREPDERTIHWFWEPTGNIGKTKLCKYLYVKYNALVISGKTNDMYYAIASNPNKRTIILCDIPRSHHEYINYCAIESIKNGLIFSGKYESKNLVFNSPHLIVFANEPPVLSKLSMDRWHIVEIKT